MTQQANKEGNGCRPWWRNCGVEADAEMLDIDRMEDKISPLDPAVSRTRKLIATLEMCHHKAERWIENIIEAIWQGETTKGLGTRSPGQLHPAENHWQNACRALALWCAGCRIASIDLTIGTKPAKQVLIRLGQRSPLKEWQVQRAIERIRSFIGWPWHGEDALITGYVPILECGSDYKSARRAECPEEYREHADFWQQTAETLLHDTQDGKPADLSLAIAIDLLMPCHWNFHQNLETILGAIGGNANPETPYTACARNIKLSPIRHRMKAVCHALQAYYGDRKPDEDLDQELLRSLGKATAAKKWLAASLDKTIRLQMGL